MKFRFMRVLFLLSVVLYSVVVFSQTIKSVKVESSDGSQTVIYDPSNHENIGLNFVQLYKGAKEFPVRFVVEVSGHDLPGTMTVKTNLDKGSRYIHELIVKLNKLAQNRAPLEPTIRELLSILPKATTDPFLVGKTENPDLTVLLYNDFQAKKVGQPSSDIAVYSTEYIPIKHEQIGNIVFQVRDSEGRVTTLPLYYEENVNKRNIYVLNIVVSPEESRKLKIQTVNPYQLGEVVYKEEEATNFKVVNRGEWKYLYSSGKKDAEEAEVFEYELFPVKVEKTHKIGYLKVLPLNDPSLKAKILEAAKNTNANTVWFMPINENSPLRMSPDLKNARVVKIGDKRYIVSLMARHPETRDELYHKGLFYQHETTAYAVSEYLGGNDAAIELIRDLNAAGLRVMLEEHPDKVSSLGMSYKSLSVEASLIVKAILDIAGYEVAEEDAEKPFDIMTTKLKSTKDGKQIYAYQFFALRYAYDGRDLNVNASDYVKKEDRVPSTDVNDMPSKVSEIYVPAVGIPNSDWTTFAQLRINNPYVELIELIARLDYYKQLFGEQTGNYNVGIREDAVHFGILRYDQRSQFVRYINELKQSFPGIIVSGEVIAHGNDIAWMGMPLDVIQPPTLMHRDNVYYADEYGRTNEGQVAWDMVVEKLKEYKKAYFSSLTSYDTCPAVTEAPFNEYAMLEKCELPYKDHFDALTKEAYVFFPPTAVNSICAGEECGTVNDYKNFKADQFGYYQLPYEEGNFNQTRVDLVTTYPMMDNLKTFLQDNKYGYNYESHDPGVTLEGHLSASVYSSEKGVVIILRNNSTLSYPMDHKFPEDIVTALNYRQTLGENLNVVYDMFEFDYGTNVSSLYNPEDNILFEKYDVPNNEGNLKLRRDFKPYEVIVLSTLTGDELENIKSEYNNAIQGKGFGKITTKPLVSLVSTVTDLENTEIVKPLVPSAITIVQLVDGIAIQNLAYYTGSDSKDLSEQLDGLMSLFAERGILENDAALLFGDGATTGGVYDYVLSKVKNGSEEETLQTFLILVGALCRGTDLSVYLERETTLTINDAYKTLGLLGTAPLLITDIKLESIRTKFYNKTKFLECFNKGVNDIKIRK